MVVESGMEKLQVAVAGAGLGEGGVWQGTWAGCAEQPKRGRKPLPFVTVH